MLIDLMAQYNQILYRTSSQDVGKTAHLAKKGKDFGHNGKFSKVFNLRFIKMIALAIIGNAQKQRT